MSPLAMWLSVQLVAAAVLTFILWRGLVSHRERQSYERFIARWKNEAKRLAGRLELSDAEKNETLESRNHWYDKSESWARDSAEQAREVERLKAVLDDQKTITERWVALASENANEIVALREKVKETPTWYYSPSLTIPYQGTWSFPVPAQSTTAFTFTGGPIA